MTQNFFARTSMTESEINMSWNIEDFLQLSQSLSEPVVIYSTGFIVLNDNILEETPSLTGPEVILPTQPKTTWKTFIDIKRDDQHDIAYEFRTEPVELFRLQKKFKIELVLSFQDMEGNILRKFKRAMSSRFPDLPIREKFAVKRHTFSPNDPNATFVVINSLLSGETLMLKCCFRVIGFWTRCHVAPENDLNCLLDSFRALHSSKQFSDFTIVVDGKTIPVHKCILSSRSPVFAAMLKGETLEMLNNQLAVEDFDFKTMETFVSYLYTAQLRELAVEEYLKLYSVSDKYELESLKKSCAYKLIRSVRADNVCDVYVLGYNHNDAALMTAAKSFLSQNFSSVLASESWKKLALQNSQLAAEMMREAETS